MKRQVMIERSTADLIAHDEKIGQRRKEIVELATRMSNIKAKPIKDRHDMVAIANLARKIEHETYWLSLDTRRRYNITRDLIYYRSIVFQPDECHNLTDFIDFIITITMKVSSTGKLVDLIKKKIRTMITSMEIDTIIPLYHQYVDSGRFDDVIALAQTDIRFIGLIVGTILNGFITSNGEYRLDVIDIDGCQPLNQRHLRLLWFTLLRSSPYEQTIKILHRVYFPLFDLTRLARMVIARLSYVVIAVGKDTPTGYMLNAKIGMSDKLIPGYYTTVVAINYINSKSVTNFIRPLIEIPRIPDPIRHAVLLTPEDQTSIVYGDRLNLDHLHASIIDMIVG